MGMKIYIAHLSFGNLRSMRHETWEKGQLPQRDGVTKLFGQGAKRGQPGRFFFSHPV